MKTAFCYHRYSYIDQKDGYTLEIQRKTTKRLADKYECKIIGIYEDEGISGATIDKRPQMLLLLDDLKNHQPNFIICVDQDRIARGNDFWYIKNLMVKSETSFITEKEGIIDFSKDVSRDFLSDIIAAAAKYERGMIKQRVKRAVNERANKGYFVGNFTNVLGYEWDPDTKNIKVNKDEAKIVKKIFDMYLKGKGYHVITSYLNLNGYRSKKGKRFSRVTIGRILKNPLYCGYITHLGQTKKGKHESIIPKEKFDAAERKYSNNKKRNPKMNVRHLLTGFLYCGSCGSRMQIGYHSSRIFYDCSGYYQNLCNKSPYIKKDKIENYINIKMNEALLNLDLDLKRDIHPKNNISNNGGSEQKVLEKFKRLADLRVDGSISKDYYDTKMVELKRELIIAKKVNQGNNHQDLSILASLKDNIQFNQLDFDTQRKLLDIFIDKIIIYRSEGRNCKVEDRAEITWNTIEGN